MRNMIALAAAISLAFAINVYADEPKVIKNGEYVICEIRTQDDAIDIHEAPPINRISEALDEQDEQVNREYLGVYYVTRYFSCRKCSGKWGTTSASGKPLIVNYSCASPLPFGTVVEIEGYGRCEVVDRTDDGAVQRTGGKIIDIYTSNHAEAEEWGCKKLKAWRVK